MAHEYFTKFKFIQFGLLAPEIPERLRAGMVGVFASWWMGIPLGIILTGIGFVQRDYKKMFSVTMQSFLVIIIALVVGMLGLLYGYFQTGEFTLSEYQGWFIPEGLLKPRRFLVRAYRHFELPESFGGFGGDQPLPDS